MMRCFSLADSSAFLAASSATDARVSTLAAAARALVSHSTAASRADLASAASRSISRACASAVWDSATHCASALSFSAAISAISSRSSVCFLRRPFRVIGAGHRGRHLHLPRHGAFPPPPTARGRFSSSV